MASNDTWTDPYCCPFCSETLASPGSGFIAHIETNPSCDTAFEIWQERVKEDVTGGWIG